LWVSDANWNRVLRFESTADNPEVVAGGGVIGEDCLATKAVLAHPGRLAVDEQGNLFVSDAMYHCVRMVNSEGRIKTVAGVGSPGFNGDQLPATSAKLNYPAGIAVDKNDHLYIADYYNNRLRAVELSTGDISTIAGNGRAGTGGDLGPAIDAELLNPNAIALDENGDILITSAVSQNLRTLDRKTGIIDSIQLDEDLVDPSEVSIFYGVNCPAGQVYLADGMHSRILAHQNGKTTELIPSFYLNYPMDVAASDTGQIIIADTRNNRVVRWDGTSIVVVLDGLARPRGLALDRAGNLFVADTFHNRVIRLPGEMVLNGQ
jgi:DNA-binding beta-propeller fold protein YncE